jgi:hypothetical protein
MIRIRAKLLADSSPTFMRANDEEVSYHRFPFDSALSQIPPRTVNRVYATVLFEADSTTTRILKALGTMSVFDQSDSHAPQTGC